MARPNKPWYRADRDCWCVKIDGKRVTLAKGRGNEAQALRAFYRLMASEGERVEPSNLTIHTLAQIFLDHAEVTTRPATYAFYRQWLKSFCERWPDLSLADLKPVHLTRWIDDHPKWGTASQRGAIVALRRLTGWAVQQGHIAVDPLRSIPRPKMPRRAVLSPEDAERAFTAATSPALRDLITALVETGCRPGEMASIEAKDLDLPASRMVVRGKSGERVVWLSEGARNLFTRLARERPTGALLRPMRAPAWTRDIMHCAFLRLRRKTGIAHVNAYAFRHLFGTLAIERGVDSLLVAELMGHKDTKMLMEFYNRTRAQTLKNAIEAATSRDRAGGGQGGLNGSAAPSPPEAAVPLACAPGTRPRRRG